MTLHMFHLIRVWSPRRTAMCAAFATFLALPYAARADSISFVQTANGQVQDSGILGSAVMIDGENRAQSFSVAPLGKMGAAVSNSLFGAESFSRSAFDDSWTCSGLCGVVAPFPPGVVPLSLDFKLDGVFTDFNRPFGVGTGTPEISILARYEIGAFGSFEFRLTENEFDRSQGPLGAGSMVSATFCHDAGACDSLPVDIVSFVDDNDNDVFSFSVDAKGNQVLCPGCAAGFVDKLSMRVSVVGGNDVSMLDALNTFQVTVHSLDPNSQFTSAAGRTTGPAADPTPVPEPATLGLLGLGLAGIGRRRWRRRS